MVACSSKEKEEVTTTDSTIPEEVETSVPAPESLSVCGVDLSNFTIVYAHAPVKFARTIKSYSSYINRENKQEYDYDYISALYLQSSIEECLGISLSVVSDSDASETSNEILVGSTNRTADNFNLSSDDDYTVAVSNGKLCLQGGTYGTTYHAVDYLIEYLEQIGGAIELDNSFQLSGQHHLTVIGCIGDSITDGIGSSNSEYLAYPADLSRILWRDCVVYNYGCSGMTMRNDTGGWAYMSSTPYQNALANAANIDVFTIMLGTNDSRGDIVNSYGQNQEAFSRSFKSLLTALRKKNSSLRFILMNCPAYYGNETYAADYILEWQSALYEKYKDSYDLSFFDMRAFTEENMPVSYYSDKLHPNDAGYCVMAIGIADMLTDYLGLEKY
jgi:lysophospholipase L1-like esterase